MQDATEKKEDGDRADEHAPLISYPFKGNTKTVNLTGSEEALDTKETGSRYHIVLFTCWMAIIHVYIMMG